MQFDPIPFDVVAGLLTWLKVMGLSALLVLGVSLLTLLATNGVRGPALLAKEIFAGLNDLASLSPKRVWALTQLTIREAIRRRALLVFVVFGVLFMFAGWFLTGATQESDFEAKMYTYFALRTISWLVLPVVLLLACWGIPEDIRIRSLHTVVTKPVRRLEVVLGRMFGVGIIGTLVLAIMGGTGYIWILRQVSPAGQSQLTCRQPIPGELTFLDREGNPGKGVNTGDLWEFRSYIEGATKSRAIWAFSNLGPSAFRPDGTLVIENRFLGFRAHKGDMNRSLLYRLTLVNPETGARAEIPINQINEFRNRTDEVPAELPGTVDGVEKKLSVQKDLVSSKGQLLVEAACVDPGQYIGMARVDLFIRTPDNSFASGYFKAVFGIELMMLLIVLLGVTASTFLKGPVATLLTFVLFIVGDWSREFLDKFVSSFLANKLEGGGVLESIYRIVMHMNPTTELPTGPAFGAMKLIDWAVAQFVVLISSVIPDFKTFDMTGYVIEGFDVPFMAAVLPSIATTLAFFIPCVVLGYYSLRLRELEAK